MTGPCEGCPPAETVAPEPKQVVNVEVWYEDEIRSSSTWEDLPDDGVLGVLVLHEDGTSRVMTGDDVYFTAPGSHGRVYGSTSNDRDREELADRYPGAVVLRGRWTDDATMKAVQDRMMERTREHWGG